MEAQLSTVGYCRTPSPLCGCWQWCITHSNQYTSWAVLVTGSQFDVQSPAVPVGLVLETDSTTPFVLTPFVLTPLLRGAASSAAIIFIKCNYLQSNFNLRECRLRLTRNFLLARNFKFGEVSQTLSTVCYLVGIQYIDIANLTWNKIPVFWKHPTASCCWMLLKTGIENDFHNGDNNKAGNPICQTAFSKRRWSARQHIHKFESIAPGAPHRERRAFSVKKAAIVVLAW